MDDSDMRIMDIIERAGGLLDLSHRYQITTNAMRLWISRGIPRRYHRDLSSLTHLPIEAIREVSLRARSERARRKEVDKQTPSLAS
jgi:hypothetical protein